VAEGSGFELSVPVSKLADDSIQAKFAESRRVQIGWEPGARKIAGQRTVSTAGGVVRLIDRKSSARSAGEALRMIFINALLNGGDAHSPPHLAQAGRLAW
jgi:hypothetical protein